jgi:hypothetical protein
MVLPEMRGFFIQPVAEAGINYPMARISPETVKVPGRRNRFVVTLWYRFEM